MQYRIPVSNWSKAPWGLSVLARVTSIFTGTSISQLLEPILCGLLSQAPLLPKLRGHFAEFLNNASSVGLRILSSSTCVGLRYGHALHNSSFSRHMAHTLHYFISLHITSSDHTTDLPIVLLPRLYRSFHSRLVLSTCVPTVLIMRGTGI